VRGVLNIVVLGAVLWAQGTTTHQDHDSPHQVNVVVRNGKGAVADLTQQDFEIFDKGKPQKIAFSTSQTR